MSNLFSTMRASLSALQTIQDSLTVVQNNVTNASAPGYTRQRLGLRALEFNPETGMAGGLGSSGLISSRDQHSETMVRTEFSLLAEVQSTLSSLTKVEGVLSLNDDSGIPKSLNRLFSAFSAWSVSPNEAGAKENVFAAAKELAASFRRASDGLHDISTTTQEQIGTTVDEINALAEHIREFNASRRTGAGADAGLDATVHNDLEALAGLIDIRTVWQEDGTVTVLAGGEAALVVGDHRYDLEISYFHEDASPANPEALPAVHISTADGEEITSHLTGGKLTALVNTRNETLPKLLGDTNNAGELNKLAKAVADRVNSVLASGYPPLDGASKLFVYGNSATSIAHAIEVNPTLAPAILDATDPLAIPPTVNGKALTLANLATPTAAADKIDGLSYAGFFGRLSADAGRQAAAAKQEAASREQLTAQARNMRAQISGISFDEEAVSLVQLQHAYQATAKMITTVDSMLEIVLNIRR